MEIFIFFLLLWLEISSCVVLYLFYLLKKFLFLFLFLKKKVSSIFHLFIYILFSLFVQLNHHHHDFIPLFVLFIRNIREIFQLNLFKGTKHVDPDTGIIYFKYDFGYEFGVIFQDGKKVIGGTRNLSENNNEQTKRQLPQRTSDIEVPVIHERTGRASVVSFATGATTPVEFERLDKAKKRYSLPSNRFSPKSGIFQASGDLLLFVVV